MAGVWNRRSGSRHCIAPALPHNRGASANHGTPMNKFTRIARNALAWLLAIGFALGAWGNVFISPKATASYERWGYPSWFHYLTAACELTATILLLVPATRLIGAAIGVVVMGTAVVTIVAAGEAPHAIPAAVVLAVSIAVFVLAYKARRRA